jgi:glycosyltransferase involved in cell wall biosynthesis
MASPPSARPLRIAIDARLLDGEIIGIQQTIRGLAEGLGSLDAGPEEYCFAVRSEHGWLRPALVGPCRAIVVGEPSRGPWEDSALGERIPALAKSLGHLWESRGRMLPAPDPALRLAGVDLVHFMQQRGFRTDLPNIYQPHDLQHEHFPELFHPLQLAYRRASYRAMAAQADRVGVMTSAAREDVVRHLRVPPEDVIVVPWGFERAGDVPASAALPAGVPARFLLYPAQSWPHKNHEGLFRALAALRARGMDVPVVLTGPRLPGWDAVIGLARDLGVGDLVIDLAFVTAEDLRALWDATEALVFPSRYEGWGLPVVEALTLGVPIVCSDISPLRELTGDAARRFEPDDTSAMAEAIAAVWTDAAERDRLRTAAAQQGERFTWARTAALFRAHYRAVLDRPLDERDRELLAAPDLL